MNGHTPGPWDWDGEIEDFGDIYIYHYDDDGDVIRICAILGNDKFKNQHQANALLISSAPELLDALRQWAWAEANGDDDELVNARWSRDAAIAKAEGRA